MLWLYLYCILRKKQDGRVKREAPGIFIGQAVSNHYKQSPKQGRTAGEWDIENKDKAGHGQGGSLFSGDCDERGAGLS